MYVQDDYSSSLNSYDPMLDDYNSKVFNSYDRGPGRNLSLDHHPSNQMNSGKLVKRSPSTSLYVVGIPPNLNDQGLMNIFSKFGKVMRCVTGEPKKENGFGTRYGFVDFGKVSEAEEALYALNNKMPYYLHVEFSMSKEEKKLKEAAKDNERNQMQQVPKQSILLTPSPTDSFSLGSKLNINVRVTGNQKTVFCPSLNNDGHRPHSLMRNNEEENKVSDKFLLEHYTACGPSQRPVTRASDLENGVDQRIFDSGVVDRRILSNSDEYKSNFVSRQPVQLPCTFCQLPGGFRCQRCKAWYCGQTCQLNDWPNHKKTCQIKLSNGDTTIKPVSSGTGQDQNLSSKGDFNSEKPYEGKPKSTRENFTGQGFNQNQNGFFPSRPKGTDICEEMPNKSKYKKAALSSNASSFKDNDKNLKKPNFQSAPTRAGIASSRQSVPSTPFMKPISNTPKKKEVVEKPPDKGLVLDCDQKSERGRGRSSRGPPNGELRRPFSKLDMTHHSAEVTPFPSLPFDNNPCKVRVCFVISPDIFYVQKVTNSEELVSKELLMLSVEVHQQAICDKPLNVPLQVGDYCIALYSTDQCWYRAKVLKCLNNKTHEVFFVDYGNKETVQLENMRLLPEKLRTVNGQAIECMLGKVAPLKNYWDADAIAGMNMLVSDVLLNCQFYIQHEGKSVVGLADEEGSDISDLMVKLSYAQTTALPEIEIVPQINKVEQGKIIETNSIKPTDKGRLTSTAEVLTPPNELDLKSCPIPSVEKTVVKPPVLSILGSLFVKPDLITATITWILDKTHFWASVCDESISQKIANLSVDLTMRYETESSGFTTIAGQVVSAKASDGVCYRAYINNKLPENSYHVTFIDFGNEKIVSSVAPLLPEEKSVICPALLLSSETPLKISVDNVLLLKMASVSPSNVIFRLVDAEGNEKSQLVGQSWFCNLFSVELSPSPSPPLEEPVALVGNMEKRVVDKVFQANVIWINSPQEVYLQLIKDVEALASLMTNIAEFVTKLPIKVTPVVDQLVLARFEDGNWYRASVKGVSEKMAQVHFCDYGNSSDISLDDIQPCPMELVLEAPFALLASLEGVTDLTQEEKSLLVEHVWKVEVSSCIHEVISVKLFGSKGAFKASNNSQPLSSKISKANVGTHASKPADPQKNIPVKATTEKTLQKVCNANKQSSPSLSISQHNTPDKNTFEEKNVPKSNSPQSKTCTLATSQSTEFYEQTFSNQPYVNMPIQEKIRTSVTFANSPDLIYLNYFPEVGSAAKFLSLCEDIKKYCDNNQPSSVYDPEFGSFCLAQFNDDLCWYRAVVLEKTTGNFNVMFVDYGNMEVTNKVIPIPSSFMKLPLQAAQCRLYGIQTQETWLPNICKELRDFLLGNPSVEVTVICVEDDGTYWVDIPTARNFMLQKKFAVPDPKAVLPSETSVAPEKVPLAPTAVVETSPAPSVDIVEQEALKQQIKELQEKLAAMCPK